MVVASGPTPLGENVKRAGLRPLLILMVAASCGRADEVAIQASGPEPATGSTKQCSSAGGGYTIRYPATWFTVDDGPVPCRFFHPKPFRLPQSTEATELAVNVQLAPVPFDEIVPRLDSADGFEEMLSRRAGHPSGLRAVRIESRTRGAGLLPAGDSRVTWYVDAGEDTLVATTSANASSGNFRANADVLDAIVAAAELRPDSRRFTSDTPRALSQRDATGVGPLT